MNKVGILTNKFFKRLDSFLADMTIPSDTELEEMFKPYAEDILVHPDFAETKNFIQHGTVSVYEHVLNVAWISLVINEYLRLQCSRRELVRASLLHDFFLYDWHCSDLQHPRPWFHGIYHPGIALKNAEKDFVLTEREKDAILKHMWPLTPVPPKYREGWVVTTADKYCGTRETFFRRKSTDEKSLGQSAAPEKAEAAQSVETQKIRISK